MMTFFRGKDEKDKCAIVLWSSVSNQYIYMRKRSHQLLLLLKANIFKEIIPMHMNSLYLGGR